MIIQSQEEAKNNYFQQKKNTQLLHTPLKKKQQDQSEGSPNQLQSQQQYYYSDSNMSTIEELSFQSPFEIFDNDSQNSLQTTCFYFNNNSNSNSKSNSQQKNQDLSVEDLDDFFKKSYENQNSSSPFSLFKYNNINKCNNTNSSKKKKKEPKQTVDRFIPNRKTSKMSIAFSNSAEDNQSLLQQQQQQQQQRNGSNNNSISGNEENALLISDIYKLHVLGLNPPLKKCELFPFQNHNMFQYKTSYNSSDENNYSGGYLGDSDLVFNLASKSQRKPHRKYFFEFNDNVDAHLFKHTRKISKVPYKVLDAPALQDDFYLNLIDWSQNNILAVGLGTSVYLWSAESSRVTKLCDLGNTDMVTSVQYGKEGNLLSIGTNRGDIQIWDTQKLKLIRNMSGHSARVGCVAWNNNTLTTGSRDKTILHRDMRSQSNYYSKLLAHKQEVCGLKWSYDGQQIASGGNDNKLYVWSVQSNQPVSKFQNHTAAIKALTWSPHQHGLLVSGGGTADRTIRSWNTLTNEQINVIDTGSQVCNLMFSKNVNELVSTHGYSQNQVMVWNYPDMEKVATLTGHTFRVLYLAMSPCGQTIVTGAGDETLRFWNIFPNNAKDNQGKSDRSLLIPSNNCLR